MQPAALLFSGHLEDLAKSLLGDLLRELHKICAIRYWVESLFMELVLLKARTIILPRFKRAPVRRFLPSH